jgi:hypothetical protein
MAQASVQVSLNDEFSSALREISDQLRGFGSSAQHAAAAATAQFKGVENASRKVGNEIRELIQLTGVTMTLLGGGVVASLGGIARSLETLSQNTLKLHSTAEALGTTTREINNFVQAGRFLGVSTGEAISSFQNLHSALQEIATKRHASQYLQQLIAGGGSTGVTLFNEILRALGPGDPEGRARAEALILSRMKEVNAAAGSFIARTFGISSTAFKDLEEFKGRLREIIEPSVELTREYNIAWVRLGQAWSDVGTKAANETMPAFTRLFGFLERQLDGPAGKWLEDTLIEWGKFFADPTTWQEAAKWMKAFFIGVGEVLGYIKAAYDVLDRDIVPRVGGWPVVITGVIAALVLELTGLNKGLIAIGAAGAGVAALIQLGRLIQGGSGGEATGPIDQDFETTPYRPALPSGMDLEFDPHSIAEDKRSRWERFKGGFGGGKPQFFAAQRDLDDNVSKTAVEVEKLHDILLMYGEPGTTAGAPSRGAALGQMLASVRQGGATGGGGGGGGGGIGQAMRVPAEPLLEGGGRRDPQGGSGGSRPRVPQGSIRAGIQGGGNTTTSPGVTPPEQQSPPGPQRNTTIAPGVTPPETTVPAPAIPPGVVPRIGGAGRSGMDIEFNPFGQSGRTGMDMEFNPFAGSAAAGSAAAGRVAAGNAAVGMTREQWMRGGPEWRAANPFQGDTPSAAPDAAPSTAPSAAPDAAPSPAPRGSSAGLGWPRVVNPPPQIEENSLRVIPRGGSGEFKPVMLADGSMPKAFVMHHTSGRGTVEGVMNTLRGRGLGVQYIMDREGNIYHTGGPGAAHMRPYFSKQGTALAREIGAQNQTVVGMEIIAKNNKDVDPKQVAAAAAFMRKYYPNVTPYGHGQLNTHKEADEGMAAVNAIMAERRGTGAPIIVKTTPKSGGTSAAFGDPLPRGDFSDVFDKDIPSGFGPKAKGSTSSVAPAIAREREAVSGMDLEVNVKAPRGKADVDVSGEGAFKGNTAVSKELVSGDLEGIE